MVTLCVHGVELHLLKERALFMSERRTLVVADLHLGKSTHFRTHGYPLPHGALHEELSLLGRIIEETSSERLVLLGDLFHSSHNEEWETFAAWRAMHHRVSVILIEGNHDLLDEVHYADAGIDVVRHLNEYPFVFRHKPGGSAEGYVIAGHLHPAVRLYGKGDQRLTFSCFWFREEYAVLPAYGFLTGTALVKPRREDTVCVITDEGVIQVQ